MDCSDILRLSDKGNQLHQTCDPDTTKLELRDSWEAIRSLDDNENWAERTRVVSKNDHLFLIQCAQEMMNELINNLPIDSQTSSMQFTDGDFQYTADQFDVDYLERISSSKSESQSALTRESLYVRFDPLVGRKSPVKSIPIKSNAISETSENTLHQFTDADFQYSASQFDVDYLQHISSEHTKQSALTRESLYVKFDPLVGKESTPQKTPISTTVTKHDGDLLLLGTPPYTRSTENNLSSNSSHLQQNAHSSMLSPSMKSTTVSDSKSLTVSSVPETDILIKVLKYSEDDLPSIIEAARNKQKELEKEKYDLELHHLRENITDSKHHLKQLRDNAQADSTISLSVSSKLEQDLNSCRDIIDAHVKRETEILDKHEALKKEDADMKEQLELISRDSIALENSFDQLHHNYVKLKEVYQALFKRDKEMQDYKKQLHAWNGQDSEINNSTQKNLQTMLQKAEDLLGCMRKDHASKMTIERAKALKLQMQVEGLQKTLNQKDQEKLELSQICDELMKELEATQKTAV